MLERSDRLRYVAKRLRVFEIRLQSNTKVTLISVHSSSDEEPVQPPRGICTI